MSNQFTCSRCGSSHGNPACYVCDPGEKDEPDGMDLAREYRERMEDDNDETNQDHDR